MKLPGGCLKRLPKGVMVTWYWVLGAWALCVERRTQSSAEQGRMTPLILEKGLVTAPPYSTCDMKLYKWIRDLEYSRMECLSIDKPSRNRPWIGRVWKPMGASLVTGCAKRWEVYWQRRMHSCCRLDKISMVKWNELMINLVISRRRNAVVRLTKMVKLLVGTTN